MAAADAHRATVATSAGAVGLSLLAVALGASGGDLPQAIVVGLLATWGPALALRIDRSLPGHLMALRLALLGLALGAMSAIDQLVLVDPDPASAVQRWAALLADASFMPALLAMAGIVVAFPTGRPEGATWVRAERVVTVAVAVALVVNTLSARDVETANAIVASPVALLPEALLPLVWLTILVEFAWLIASFVALRRRYRRSAGIERLQLAWLAYGGASVPLSMGACLAAGAAGADGELVTSIAFVIPLVLVPAAVTVAVLRHRLYEIDRLVNRTLVYLVVSVALVGAYAAIALVIGVTLGSGATWTTAAATLAIATAFRPVRDRAQSAVDHRFARRRHTGLRHVASFLEDVRAGRAEPERIGSVLASALDDPGLEVLFRLPASGGYADAAGRHTELPNDGVRMRTPVTRGDVELGVVVHDPKLADRADTLDSVLRATGLVLEIARLRAELRVQLAEVEASRGRLAAAAAAERRKLERDLHDGAQQRLVALGLDLRHAQYQLDADREGARRTLDEAVAGLAAAVFELREMARGLRPSLLDHGLGPALTEVAERSPLPVSVEIAPTTGLPPEVEVTAFFLACEALTNAVKHAGASHIRIRVDQRGAGVRIEVADDGRGGARMVAGGGLDGLRLRAAAHGGQLEIDSDEGRGTRLVAELPSGA